MSLKPQNVTFALLRCTFCGAVHANMEEAKAFGCTKKPSQPAFAVGDEVYASVRIGAGMEHVGNRTIRCRVIDVKQPSVVGDDYIPDKLPVEVIDGLVELRINLPGKHHEWMYSLEAMEEHPSPNRSYYTGYLFRESELRPANMDTAVRVAKRQFGD